MTTKLPSDVTPYDNIAIASSLDASRGGLHFVLIGAGGNGARLVPPLVQIMHATDHLSIVDHDIVEDRNLGRQHFAPPDVGRYKAMVLSERYRRRVGTDTISVSAHTSQLTEESAPGFMNNLSSPTRTQAVVFLGCVDNAAARRAIVKAMQVAEMPTAWVDVGNAFKDGQVILSLRSWPMTMKLNGVAQASANLNLRGMELAMPQLLVTTKEQEEEASCRDRVDLQSVMINVQAASAALNVASWLKLRSQILSCGSFFTSACSMQPIGLKGYSARNREIVPDTAFAAE